MSPKPPQSRLAPPRHPQMPGMTMQRGIINQLQPKGSFFAPAVPPLSVSSITLPGGPGPEPYYYSLGVDSTIPFVSLKGGGTTEKVISWGEMIEVLPGQTVTVKNESFMKGDIQINSGHDFAAKPERISVPVDVVGPEPDPNLLGITRLYSVFPADTRRCRRAYLKFQCQAGNDAVSIQVLGKPQKHSFPGIDIFTGQHTYTEIWAIPALTTAGSVPLGFGGVGSNTLEPMGLTDTAGFTLTYLTLSPPLFLNTLFFYTLEY